jgi:hypothetical protein
VLQSLGIISNGASLCALKPIARRLIHTLQEAIDDILTGLSTIAIVLCSKIDFLSSFIRNFLHIAALLPSCSVFIFLELICEILLQVPLQRQSVDFLKVFPSDLLQTLCDCLSSSIQPSLLWNKIFVFMILRSNLSSFELYGESLILETTIASEFGFAASKCTMGGCSLDLEVAFFIILHSLEFTQDRQCSSRFLNSLCSTCLAMTSPSRVTNVALNITSRLKSVDTCATLMLEVFKNQHDNYCAHTKAFTSRCRMGVLLACQSHSDLDIAGQVWSACSSGDGYIYLMQHLKEHLSLLLKFGNPIQKEFMKILSFCPSTSELVSFVFEFQCAPIYALQTMGHLLRMQPEQKLLSEKNVEDLISYLRRWNVFLLDSKKSKSELDKIWGFWIDLWSSLSIHLSFETMLRKRSKFIQDSIDLIDENACKWLVSSLTAMHMHTSNQNQVVVRSSSIICKAWLEKRLKFSGIRKSLLQQFMQQPDHLKDQFCGFFFEALLE